MPFCCLHRLSPTNCGFRYLGEPWFEQNCVIHDIGNKRMGFADQH